MKVFIDTNVLISAALFPNSVTGKAFIKAVSHPNHAIVCEENIVELKRIFNKKFPNKVAILDTFLSLSMLTVEVVSVPNNEIEDEKLIRDEKDRPIFRAAVANGSDVFLSGDKDFLESGISDPRIISPGDFITLN